MLQAVLARKAGGVGLAGGDVAEAEARAAAVQEDAADVVPPPLLQSRGIGDRARGHYPDDVPSDHALGGSRVLHLLADGHLVPLGDEPGHIGVAGMVGHAAHRHLLLLGLAPVPGGEGQVQLLGRGEGVLVEHLVKIPQAEEQDGVLVLLLNLQILAHHGGHLCHCGPPSFRRRIRRAYLIRLIIVNRFCFTAKGRRAPFWRGALLSWADAGFGRTAGEGGAHPPGGNFLLVQKVTKNTLRGSAPKDPKFLEQGRGEVYIRNLSIVGLPTNPGTLRSPPAGLLYSGR